MCRAYVFKCFLNFNIKFSVWRIKLFEGHDCEDYYEEIEDRTAYTQRIADWLFLDTD